MEGHMLTHTHTHTISKWAMHIKCYSVKMKNNLKLLVESVKTGCYTVARLTAHLFWLVLWSFLLPCLTAATLPFTTMNQTVLVDLSGF